MTAALIALATTGAGLCGGAWIGFAAPVLTPPGDQPLPARTTWLGSLRLHIPAWWWRLPAPPLRLKHVALHPLHHIEEKPVTTTDTYEGRHRWHTGLTGMFPTLPCLPIDPTTAVLDGELAEDRDAELGGTVA